MKLDDDYAGDSSLGPSVLYMGLAVSAFILLILGIVFYVNRKNNASSNSYAEKKEAVSEKEAGNDEDGNRLYDKITADDLDIWDMYPEDDADVLDEENLTETEITSENGIDEIKTDKEAIKDNGADDEKFDDGKHFKIELSDGSSEWITIDKDRKLNSYDFTNMVNSDGKLKFSSDANQKSFLGIDVSRYQKDIDYNQVKNAGIQFVMIRVGARGYQTGQLSVDEYFENNIQKAQAAGLDVGVYFYSQAINANEALEEAAVVMQALTKYKITYPVAFVMEPVSNDTSRIDNLSKDDRTVIANTFLNAMASIGCKTLLYGNEEWLVKKLDLTKIPTISIWLADESNIPDYPYQYSMWQYSKKANIAGVSGAVNMDVCFVDYSAQ